MIKIALNKEEREEEKRKKTKRDTNPLVNKNKKQETKMDRHLIC